jgi:hypothetical protein
MIKGAVWKQTFWKSDWFAGLVISLLFLFADGSEIARDLRACMEQAG